MKKLSVILQSLLDEEGISANELARYVGVPQPVIHRILKDKTNNPSVLTLSPIAKYFSISISQLIGDAPLPKNKSADFEGLQESKNIPIISWCCIKDWIQNKSQASILNFISIEKNVSTDTFALKMSDFNSNITDPRFHQDSIIIVEPNIALKNRDYVIVCGKKEKASGCQCLIRQLLIDGSDQYLKPLNAETETKKIGVDEKIIGVIIEARHNYVELDER